MSKSLSTEMAFHIASVSEQYGLSERQEAPVNPHYARGVEWEAKGSTTEHLLQALRAFEACIECEPANFAAHAKRAHLSEAIGDLHAARESANKAIQLNPESGYGYLVRGQLNMVQRSFADRDYHAAIADLDKAAKLGDPDKLNLFPVNWETIRQVAAELKNPTPPKLVPVHA